MKKIIVSLLVLLLVVVGCSDLPPEPGQPGEGDIAGDVKTGSAIRYVPSGYAPPEDIFNQIGTDENGEPNYQQIFYLSNYIFNLGPEDTSLSLTSTVKHEDAYVYKYGYYYSPNQEKWIQYEFPGETVSGSNWIREQADTYINIPTNNIISGENYIVSYSCKKQDGQWKCGCRNENSCGYWMLNTFVYMTVDLPPEPEQPGSPILMRAYVNPRNEIIEQNSEINLNVWFETSYDLSQGMDDTFPVTLEKPDGTKERINLESRGNVYCDIDEENSRFSCSVSFSTQYVPSLLGEYKLSVIEDVNDLPEHIRVYNGGFKVYSAAELDDVLIRKDIGSFEYDIHNIYFGYYSNYDGDSFYSSYRSDNEGRGVQVYTGENAKRRRFDNWIDNEGVEEETLVVDGVEHKLYMIEYDIEESEVEGVPEEVYRNAEVRWLSGDKVISVHAWAYNTNLDKTDVIKAYLRRYPSSSSNVDLPNYPDYFIQDGKFNGLLVVGDSAPAEDVISISDIAMSLQYNAIIIRKDDPTITKIEVGTTKLASEVSDPYAQNIITVGRPCVNAITADFLGNPSDCYNGLPTGYGIIKLMNLKGKIQLMVFGHDNADTRTTSAVITNYKDYNLKGTEQCVHKVNNNPVVVSCKECTDSDGGNDYYVKGTVNYPVGGSNTDLCIKKNSDGSWGETAYEAPYVVEYSCPSDTNYGKEQYLCPNGCQDGACLLGSNVTTCTDSDGGIKIYSKGKTISSINGEFEDKCLTDSEVSKGTVKPSTCTSDYCFVTEFFCSTNTAPGNYNLAIGQVMPCQNGCKDGACISGVNVTTCTDSEIEIQIKLNQQQAISEVKNLLKSSDLPKLLKGGFITTEKGTSLYSQNIRFSSTSSGYVNYMENDDDVTSNFLYFKGGAQIAKYSLEFKTSLKSDIENSNGSKTLTGTYLGDFEDETISILRRDYSIVNAKRDFQNSVALTLITGPIADTLNEGETKTYTLEGKDYEVTVLAITNQEPIYVKFMVNGESTRSLTKGDSHTLVDGTLIAVSDILPQETGDLNYDLVELYLKAQVIYLKDSNVGDTTSSNDLEVNAEIIDDAHITITGSDDNSVFNIDTIQIDIEADDDYFVAAGHSLTEYMDEPQAFLNSWDISFNNYNSATNKATLDIGLCLKQ